MFDPSSDCRLDRQLLGRAVRRLRMDLEMTLQSLGRAAGMSHSHVLRIEAGEIDVSADKLFRLSNALGTSPGMLLQDATILRSEPFLVAAANCATLDQWARVKPENYGSRRRLMVDFVAGTAYGTAFLWLSCNAQQALGSMSFPIEDQAKEFQWFARCMDGGPWGSEDRISTLRTLASDPMSELKLCGLVQQEWAEEYVSLATTHPPGELLWFPWHGLTTGPVSFPWMPVPRVLPAQQQTEHARDLMSGVGIVSQPRNLRLHKLNEVGNNYGVPRTLSELLARLRTATEKRGKKTELAAQLGVPLPSVSQWLSGEREPGGETTLRLLEWVQAEEGKQQKSSAGALTPAEPRTRTRKSREEKPSPSP